MKNFTKRGIYLIMILCCATSFAQVTGINNTSHLPHEGIENKSVAIGNGLTSVLIVGTPLYSAFLDDVESKLDNTGLIDASTFFATTGTPPITDLFAYDAVFLFLDDEPANANELSANLGYYIEQGGVVVDASFTPSTPIPGAFSNYELYSGGNFATGSNLGIGSINLPNHPILNNVNTFDGGTLSLHNTDGTVAGGATIVAEYTTGEPLIIIQENVGFSDVRRVFLNFFPPSSDLTSSFWDTNSDGALLMANSLVWASMGLNDDPISAIDLTVGAAFEDFPEIADNTNATASEVADPTIPAPTCANYQGGDVWYRATVPASGAISFETNRTDPIDITDTGMSVYEGTVGVLIEVACDDDDSADGNFSLIELQGRTPGEVLYIRIWEFGGNAVGTFQVSAYDIPSPANDDLDGVIPLTVGTLFTDFPEVGTNVGATASELVDPSIPAPACAAYEGKDVWYSVQVPSTGTITIETNGVVDSSLTDTGMSVYEGTVGALIEVDCDDDDSADGNFSSIDLTGRTPGEVLYIRVWEYNNDDFGEFQVAAYSDCAVNGGEIELADGTTEATICVDDGAEAVDVTLGGTVVGTNSQWVITDIDAVILDLPAPPPFDLSALGLDTFLIWHLSFEDGLTGATVGESALDLAGCFDLSNAILVTITNDPALCGPENDACSNAISVHCGTTEVGTTSNATDSGNNPSADVFYTYTGGGLPENVTLSLCDGGTDYDSFLRVFDDGCALGSEIALNDDSCDLQSEVTFLSDGTTTYTIMIEGFEANTGNFSLAISCEVFVCDAPTNLVADDFAEDSVDISWSASTNAGSYIWEIQNEGTPQGTSGAIATGTATGNSDTAMGTFVNNSEYTLYVASVCDADSPSDYASTDFVYSFLGLNDLAFNGFSMYPNPATEILNLQARNSIEEVVLYNMLGQQVLSQKLNMSNASLNVSTLTTGTYMLRVTIDGAQQTFKVVKK